MSMYEYCNSVVICSNLLPRNSLISGAKCRRWITKLDNKTLYFYGFLKSTLIKNGETMGRDKLDVG